MGKYDNEIKEALKIGQDWVKITEKYAAEFEGIKKNNLKLEKDALTTAQKAIDRGDHNKSPNDAKALADELETIRGRLEEYKRAGQKLFDEHEKWALGDPRSNMGFIGKKLKLGDARSEAYLAVAEGIKRQLTEVGKAISTTQKSWKEDLLFQLDAQLDRVKALEKILAGEQGKSSAFLDQVRGEAQRFVAQCDKLYNSLKISADVADLSAIKAGKLDGKDSIVYQQKYQLYEKKSETIPQIVALIEKNHGRVLKSVPKNFMDGFFASKEKKEMDAKKTEVMNKLKAAKKLYDSLKKSFVDKKYV